MQFQSISFLVLALALACGGHSSPPGGGGPPPPPPPPPPGGGWQNVTPTGISLNPSLNGFNHGILDVVADPAHIGTFYLGTYQQGIWKTTDTGTSWTKVSAAGSGPDKGRNWGMAITPDGGTLYTFSGYGSGGLWKSTDGGVNWAQTWTDPTGGQAGNDLYMVDMDPADPNHLILTLHGNAPNASFNSHVFESTTAGASWRDAGAGSTDHSGYAFFLDSTTWLVVSQSGALSGGGTFRTTNSGGSWARVGTANHAHGACQIAVFPNGTVYVADTDNGGAIWKSTDKGASFSQVFTGVPLNGVFSTPSTLYANFGWSSDAPINPSLHHAWLGSDTKWTADPTPSGMTYGSKRVAVIFDGSHHVALGGFYLAGVWRYTEN